MVKWTPDYKIANFTSEVRNLAGSSCTNTFTSLMYVYYVSNAHTPYHHSILLLFAVDFSLTCLWFLSLDYLVTLYVYIFHCSCPMPINRANWGDSPFGCIISKHPLMFDNNFDSRGERRAILGCRRHFARGYLYSLKHLRCCQHITHTKKS